MDAQQLMKEINSLKEDVKKLQEENKQIKEENKEMKEKMQILEEQVGKFNEGFSEEMKQKQKHKTLIKESEIIKKEEEGKLLGEEIKKKLGKNVVSLKKLFDSKKDGDRMKTVHEKVDNIPNTLVVIESAGGKRFGGFASATWDQEDSFKDDKNAFLFSLDKLKTYAYKNNGKAIQGWVVSMWFGEGQIGLGDKFTIDKTCWTNTKDAKRSFDGPDFVLGDYEDETQFSLKKLEVFEVILE